MFWRGSFYNFGGCLHSLIDSDNIAAYICVKL